MSITDLLTGNNQEVKWLGAKNLDEAGRFCFASKISYETCAAARRSMAPTSTGSPVALFYPKYEVPFPASNQPTWTGLN